MFETIRKIKQICRKINCRYRTMKKEIRRHKALSHMESKGIVLCRDELEDNF